MRFITFLNIRHLARCSQPFLDGGSPLSSCGNTPLFLDFAAYEKNFFVSTLLIHILGSILYYFDLQYFIRHGALFTYTSFFPPLQCHHMFL